MSVFFSNSNLNILDLLLKEYLSLVPGTDLGYGLLRMSMAEVTGAPWIRINILLDFFKIRTSGAAGILSLVSV